MPFTHFICESTGESVAAPECLACARKGALPGCQMTAPVVRGILNGIRPPDFGVTVTTLLGCTRKARLKDLYDYGEKPSALWWAYRGQLMHGIAAGLAADDPHVLAETRLSWLIEMPDGREVEISGQPDLVYTDTAHLMDYKTTKAVPQAWRIYTCPNTGAVIREGQWAPPRNFMLDCPHCGEKHPAKPRERLTPPRPYESHALQVSFYATLLRENGIPVKTAEIVYQDMSEQLRIPIDLLPTEEVYRLAVAALTELLGEELPAPLPDDAWECDYCPVRAICKSLL
jgi:hypothetical protein